MMIGKDGNVAWYRTFGAVLAGRKEKAMCKFFSLVSDGNGKPYYFDWPLRQKVLSGELKNYEPDSHTSIADYFGFKKEKEDELNKYEYNPFLKKFEVDQINTKDDSAKIEKFCKQLDFKKIIEPVTIKKIIHPFQDIESVKVMDEDIALLKEANSVWNSVRDSVWAQIGSMFALPQWKYCEKVTVKGYPFQAYVNLWNKGLVPSFDGKVWRLHGGKDAKVLWEGTVAQLGKKG